MNLNAPEMPEMPSIPGQEAKTEDVMKDGEEEPSEEDKKEFQNRFGKTVAAAQAAKATYDRAEEARQRVENAQNQMERLQAQYEAQDFEEMANKQVKRAKVLESGALQGLGAGAGIGAATGIGVGTIVGTVVGGTASIPTTGLGALIGLGAGVLHGPWWKGNNDEEEEEEENADGQEVGVDGENGRAQVELDGEEEMSEDGVARNGHGFEEMDHDDELADMAGDDIESDTVEEHEQDDGGHEEKNANEPSKKDEDEDEDADADEPMADVGEDNEVTKEDEMSDGQKDTARESNRGRNSHTEQSHNHAETTQEDKPKPEDFQTDHHPTKRPKKLERRSNASSIATTSPQSSNDNSKPESGKKAPRKLDTKSHAPKKLETRGTKSPKKIELRTPRTADHGIEWENVQLRELLASKGIEKPEVDSFLQRRRGEEIK